MLLQNTKTGDGNVRHLVYLIENAILNLPEGQEQMSWLIDFTGYSINASNIQPKTTRDIVNVLQNHYPERLAITVLYNPPKLFQACFKVPQSLFLLSINNQLTTTLFFFTKYFK